MNNLFHLAFPVKDLEESRRFYGEVLGYKMKRILTIVFISASLMLTQCAKSEVVSDKNSSSEVEIHEAKKFVIGKWKATEESTGEYFLIFKENNLVIQEYYGNRYNGEINRYSYKINENNDLEIEQDYETNLIVKKINEDEFELKPKKEGAFVSPPILFFFHKFKKVSE
jgi:hypothetical protein